MNHPPLPVATQPRTQAVGGLGGGATPLPPKVDQ